MPDGLDDYLNQFKKKQEKWDESVPRVLDDEFSKLGYGDAARLSILGDIGRENSWNRKTIFEGHVDPASYTNGRGKIENRGIISWNGDRKTALDGFLKKEGVLGRGDDDELRGMARFMDQELQTPEFAHLHKKLKSSTSTYDASEALRQYIKYDAGPKYNSPDSEFRVKINANWAKRAKSLGLGQRGLDKYLEGLSGGDALDQYLDGIKGGKVAPDSKQFLHPGESLAPDQSEPAPISQEPSSGEGASGSYADFLGAMGLPDTADSLAIFNQKSTVQNSQPRAISPLEAAGEQSGSFGSRSASQGMADAAPNPGQTSAEVRQSNPDDKDVETRYREWLGADADTKEARGEFNKILAAQFESGKTDDLLDISNSIKNGGSYAEVEKKQKEIRKRYEAAKATDPTLTPDKFNDILASENEAVNAKSKSEWLAKNPDLEKFAKSVGKDPFADGTIEAFNETQRQNQQRRQKAAQIQQKLRPVAKTATGYDFQKPGGKITIPAVPNVSAAEDLKYIADPSLEKNGEYRFTDSEGDVYIFNPKAGGLVAEDDATVVSKVELPLPEKGTQPTAVTKRAWAELIADDVARYADIPREDVADYFAQYGFSDFDTGKDLSEDRFTAGKFVNPVTGLAEDAKTDTYNLTQRNVNRMLAFSKDRADTKAVYEKAKTEYSSAGDDEYTAEVKARKDAGWMTPTAADDELALYQQKKKDVEEDYATWGGDEFGFYDDNDLAESTAKSLADLRNKYGSFAAVKAEEDRIAKLPISERVTEAGRSLVATIPKALGAILKTAGAAQYGLGQIQNKINEVVGGSPLLKIEYDKIQDTPLYEIGDAYDWLGDWGKNEVAHNAWESKTADTIGQVATQAGAAWATGGLALPATLGLTQGFSAAVDDAAKTGATPNEQLAMGTIGAIAAMPDLLLMKGWFKSFTGAARVGLVKKIGQSVFRQLVLKGATAAESSTVAKLAMTAFVARAGQLGQKILFTAEKEVFEPLTKMAIAGKVGKGMVGEGFQEWSENDINLVGKKLIYKPEITWGDIAKITDDDIESMKYGAIGGAFGGVLEIASHPDAFKSYKDRKAAYAAIDKGLLNFELVKDGESSFTLGGKTFKVTDEIADVIGKYQENHAAMEKALKGVVDVKAKAKKTASFKGRRDLVAELKGLQQKITGLSAERSELAAKLITKADAGDALEREIAPGNTQTAVNTETADTTTPQISGQNMTENMTEPDGTTGPETQKYKFSDIGQVPVGEIQLEPAVPQNTPTGTENGQIASESAANGTPFDLSTSEGRFEAQKAAKVNLKTDKATLTPESKPIEDEKTPHEFSSTQVALEQNAASAVVEAAKAAIDPSDLYEPEGGLETRPHITLKFGLHAEDPREVRAILKSSGVKSIEAKFGKTKIFTSNPDYDVVVVDVKSPQLHKLNERITKGTETTDTHPNYQPHLTLAYVKKGAGAKYAGLDLLSGQKHAFGTVEFSNKRRELTEIPLTTSERATGNSAGKAETQKSAVKIKGTVAPSTSAERFTASKTKAPAAAEFENKIEDRESPEIKPTAEKPQTPIRKRAAKLGAELFPKAKINDSAKSPAIADLHEQYADAGTMAAKRKIAGQIFELEHPIAQNETANEDSKTRAPNLQPKDATATGKPKRMSAADKYEEDLSVAVKAMKDRGVTQDGTVYLSAQQRGPNGSLIMTDAIAKEAGFEPVEGRLNYYQKAGAKPEKSVETATKETREFDALKAARKDLEKHGQGSLFRIDESDGSENTLKDIDGNPALKSVPKRAIAERPKAQVSDLGFYSGVEQAIIDKMPAKASAEQIRGILKDQRAEELEWLDIGGFLATKPTFTRNDVLEYIRANSVEIHETVLSSGRIKQGDLIIKSSGTQPYDLDGESGTLHTFYADITNPHPAYEEHGQRIRPGAVFETKDGKFHVGIFTDQPMQFDTLEEAKREINERALTRFEDENLGDPYAAGSTQYENYTLPGGKDYKEFVFHLPTKTEETGRGQNSHIDGEGNFVSPHFGVNNPIGHARADIRDGGKTWHIAELQSESLQMLRDLQKRIDDGETLNPSDQLNYDTLKTFPFQKSWHKFLFKSMLRRAIEAGAEQISWDTGSTQNDRYDLAQAVDWVDYRPSSAGKRVTISYKKDNLTAAFQVDSDGKIFAADIPDINGKTLVAAVGKDIAKQITGGKEGRIEGENLKVGGTGMIAFYSQILPADVNKYVKPFGAKVEDGDVTAQTEDVMAFAPAHILKITPSMKESVETKGQPLFKVRTAEALDDLEKLAQKNDFSEIVPKVLTSIEGKNTLYLETPEAAETVRTLLAIAQDEERDTQPILEGLFLEPHNVEDLIEAADAFADVSEQNGVDAETIRDLVANLETASFANGTVKLKVFDEALPHEEFHEASWLAPAKKNLADRYAGLNQLAKDNAEFQKAFGKWVELENRDWDIETASPYQLGHAAEEILAYVSDGSRESLGLSVDEASDLGTELAVAFANARIAEDDTLDVGTALATFKGTVAERFISRVEEKYEPNAIRSGRGNDDGAVRSAGPGREALVGNNARDQGGDERGVQDSNAGPGEGESPGEARSREQNQALDAEKAEAAADGTSPQEVRVKNRKYAATLRENGRDADDVPYIPESEPGWINDAKAILAKSRELADVSPNSPGDYEYAIDAFNSPSSKPSLKTTLGLALIDHLGAAGDYEQMRRVAETTVNVVGTAAQALRASQLVSKYDFAKGVMLAKKAIEDRGKTLTDKDIDQIRELTKKYADSESERALMAFALEEAKTAIDELKADRDEIAKSLETTLGTLSTNKRALSNLRRQFERWKEKALGSGHVTVRVSKTHKELLERKAAIYARIREKFPDKAGALKSVAPLSNAEAAFIRSASDRATSRTFDDETRQNLAEYAALQIFDGISYEDTIKNLNEITEGVLNAAEIRSIHADAVEMTRGEGVQKSDAVISKLKIRSDHRARARAYRAEQSGNLNRLEREILKIADTDEQLGIAGVYINRAMSKADWFETVGQEMPDLDRRQKDALFEKAFALKMQARRLLEKQLVERKKDIEISEKEFSDIQRLAMLARAATTRQKKTLDRYYIELQKGTGEKIVDAALNVISTPKSLMSTAEVSYVLRQGFIPTVLFTKDAAKGLEGVLRGLQSEESRLVYQEKMREHPRFTESQIYGVEYGELGDNPVTDEHFISRVFEKGETLVGNRPDKLVARSVSKAQRKFEFAYTLPGDAQRLFVFDTLANIVDQQTLTELEAKEAKRFAAKIANRFTGRGDIRGIFNPGGAFGKFLNAVGFAPKFAASRFQSAFWLSPISLPFVPKGMRKTLARKQARWYGTMAAMAALIALLLDAPDDDDERNPWGVIDPASKNFLKGRIRGTDYKIDLTSNMSEGMRLFFANWVGSGYYAATGQWSKLTDIWKQEKERYLSVGDKDIIPRYWRGKLSPTASYAYDAATGYDFIGRKFDWWAGAKSRLAPLTYQQAYDGLTYNPYESIMREPMADTSGIGGAQFERLKAGDVSISKMLAILIPSAIGLNVQQYAENEQSDAEKKAWSMWERTYPDKRTEDQARAEGGLRKLYRMRQAMEKDHVDLTAVDNAIKKYASKYGVADTKLDKIREQATGSRFEFVTKDFTPAQVEDLIKEYATAKERPELEKILEQKRQPTKKQIIESLVTEGRQGNGKISRVFEEKLTKLVEKESISETDGKQVLDRLELGDAIVAVRSGTAEDAVEAFASAMASKETTAKQKADLIDELKAKYERAKSPESKAAYRKIAVKFGVEIK